MIPDRIEHTVVTDVNLTFLVLEKSTPTVLAAFVALCQFDRPRILVLSFYQADSVTQEASQFVVFLQYNFVFLLNRVLFFGFSVVFAGVAGEKRDFYSQVYQRIIEKIDASPLLS